MTLLAEQAGIGEWLVDASLSSIAFLSCLFSSFNFSISWESS